MVVEIGIGSTSVLAKQLGGVKVVAIDIDKFEGLETLGKLG